MNDRRQDGMAGKAHHSVKIDGEARNAKDLTRQEAQIEELLSKGESTEGDADEEQDDSPADRKPPR